MNPGKKLACAKLLVSWQWQFWKIARHKPRSSKGGGTLDTMSPVHLKMSYQFNFYLEVEDLLWSDRLQSQRKSFFVIISDYLFPSSRKVILFFLRARPSVASSPTDLLLWSVGQSLTLTDVVWGSKNPKWQLKMSRKLWKRTRQEKNTDNMSIGSHNQSNNIATKFLKAVSTSCRAFGTSKEAAEYARRKCFALQDYFGMHSLFLAINPDDTSCFLIRLYVKSQKKVHSNIL